MGISYFESASINTVPNFVRARTRRGLRLAMLRNNARLKGFVKYFEIYKDPDDGFHYAWFYETTPLAGLDDGN